jgi:exoribonuclease R
MLYWFMDEFTQIFLFFLSFILSLSLPLLTIKFFETDPDASIRRDLTKIPVFTIDMEKSFEIDDGLSVVTDESGDDWLYIHIADPTRYIEPRSHFDFVGRERISSVFLPEGVFPLFPPILSKRLFSLLPKKKTCVISFGVKLAPDGSVEKYQIFPALIEKVIPLTFEEMDSILFGRVERMTTRVKNVEMEYLPLIKKLEQMAKMRRLYRLERKAVLTHVPRPEVSVIRRSGVGVGGVGGGGVGGGGVGVGGGGGGSGSGSGGGGGGNDGNGDNGESDGYGELYVKMGIISNPNKNARGIVSEFMLLAGEVAADFCHQRKICAIYRTQQTPFLPEDQKTLSSSLRGGHKQKTNEGGLQEILLRNELIVDESEIGNGNENGNGDHDGINLSKVQQRNYEKKASYILEQVELTKRLAPTLLSVSRAPHCGLGLSGYCQVTSPIRRYVDFINHYQLKSGFRSYVIPPFSSQMIFEMLPKINEKTSEIAHLQRQSERFWILKYIEEQKRISSFNVYRAVVISNVPQTDVSVMMLKFGLQVKMVSTRPLQKGEILEVYVEHVDPFFDVLILKKRQKQSVNKR